MNLRLAQILALTSTALIALTALVLVSYFTYQDYRALRAQVEQRSRELAIHSAQLLEFPLFTGDRLLLERHVQRLLDHPLVEGIEVRDPQNRTLVRIGDLPPHQGLLVSRPVRAQFLDAGEADLGLDAPLTDTPLGHVRLGITLAETRDRQTHLLAQGALILLLCLLLGGALSWHLGRRLARPIQRLSDAADALARGELHRRVDPEGPREVASLGRHFNDMAAALERARNELQREVERATQALQRALKRQEEKNRELEQARRAAQAASEAKGRFLANMSHEIRTPMNAIVGFTRLLYKATPDPAQRHHLLTIQHSAESLLTLIDDILELAQMEKGNVHLRAVDFDLRVVLDDVCALLAPLAHEKRLELALLVEEDVPTDLNGDPCRLKQILNNLIGNAIKYTPDGEVVVRVAQSERGEHGVLLKFTIADTGIGIDEEQRQRIFQAFSQGDEAVTRSYEGSGLGLTIARSLVLRMGGEIDFESRPGLGTTFWFTIWVGLQPPRPQPAPPLAGRRLLLAEPHPVSRQALAQDLRRLGAEVHVFTDLEDASADPAWRTVDARLLAIGSPRRLTSDQLRRLSRWAAEAAPPTLILANSASLADYQTLAQAGIATPLNKPVPRDLLAERLEHLLRAGEGLPRARPLARLERGRVLICEDNAVNRALYLALFQEMGLEPEIMESAEAALARLQAGGIDLVIMDVHMPGMSGLEAIRRIRALPEPVRRVPVICVSADVYSQKACQEAGADAFLSKPIDEQRLAALLRQHLKRPTTVPQGLRADLHRRLLPLLREALPEHQRRIRQAWRTRDIAALRAELHKLRGACAYCHVPRLKAAVQALDKAVKEGEGDVALALEDLERAAQEIIEARGEAPSPSP